MRFLIGSLTLLLTGAIAAQVATDQNVASTKDIMTILVIPGSNAVFEAGEKPTDKEWAELRRQALILAEAGNLLMTPGRALTGPTRNVPKGKGKATVANPAAWNKAAGEMRAAASLALTAVDKKNTDLLSGDAAGQILDSCSACHDQFMIK